MCDRLLFAANMIWAVYSLFPSAAEKEEREADLEEEKEWRRYSRASFELSELPKAFEADDREGLRSARSLGGMKSAMKAAMTPRTLTFSRLEGRVAVRRGS